MDFADIVHESEQSPLYIHFQFGAQRETVHALVYTDFWRRPVPQYPGVGHRPAFHLHCPFWLSSRRSGSAVRYRPEWKDTCVMRLACSNNETSKDRQSSLQHEHDIHHRYDSDWAGCGHDRSVLFPVDKDIPACFHQIRNQPQ